jgi:hypothetical protein
MLFDRRLVAGLAGLLTAARVNAACSSNLVIDDFTTWLSGLNNLDSQNGGASTSPSVHEHG